MFENGGLDATRATVPADLPSFATALHAAPAARGPAFRELAQHLREAMARPQVAA
ncbi:hypothetical protein [Methylobacterium nonmethylotrophicum]|uniref:hypothetical protein n=1 Tax=Methylobacterium nonmethylotrophicum TaxID=1141884 RepID=UPI001436BEBF|nr:hypothetical protein [Methylobacterium nonmethylotrophicum]